MSKRKGLMLDCSRNAVKNIFTLKKIVDLSSELDFTSLYLYMEDVYELEDEPFFGHMRGRFSSKELKDLDSYANKHKIEIIPCIQTLAHLNQIFPYNCYKNIRDWDDILLVNNEKTYNLIEKMFSFIKKTFKTKFVNVGMDEAYMFARGNYLRFNPFETKIKVFLKHLSRVNEIAKKYELEIGIYSDSLLGFEQRIKTPNIKKEVQNNIPKNLTLINWDYYSPDYKHYAYNLKKHLEIKNTKVMFACGIWTWTGFAPNNVLAIGTLGPGIKAAVDCGVEDIMITAWGDDGAECSIFSALPSIFYASCLLKNITNMDEIKRNFKSKFKIDFDDFMKTDILNQLGQKNVLANPSKYFLYNDPFIGLFDENVPPNCNSIYKKHSLTLKKLMLKSKEYKYVFEKLYGLAEVLSIKADLGVRTHKAYLKKDFKSIKQIIKDFDLCKKKLNVFLESFRNEWFKENKAFGFEIQEIRIGGLIARLESCKSRLEKYLKHEIKTIPELEEKRYLYARTCYEQDKKIPLVNLYNEMISTSKL